jgi:outer membrane receptor protein involved in Fe transport
MTPKLQIGASTMIIGPRTAIRSQQLDGFILVHSNLSYSFNEHLGAYIRLNNLLSQRYEWWQGFQEAPLHLFGGISYEF